jgi:hypothetical protein
LLFALGFCFGFFAFGLLGFWTFGFWFLGEGKRIAEELLKENC